MLLSTLNGGEFLNLIVSPLISDTTHNTHGTHNSKALSADPILFTCPQSHTHADPQVHNSKADLLSSACKWFEFVVIFRSVLLIFWKSLIETEMN